MRNKTHRNRRRKQCGAKRCYLTREEAAANMLLLAGTTGTTGLNVYRCRNCEEFHVGHTPPRILALFDPPIPSFGHGVEPCHLRTNSRDGIADPEIEKGIAVTPRPHAG